MKANHKIIASLTSVVLLLMLVMTISFWSYRQIERVAEVRQHTYTVINNADALISELKDAEIAAQSYLLSGDEDFLKPYVAVRNNINDHLKELRRQTLLTTAQKHLDALVPLIDAKLAETSHAIELRRHPEETAAITAVSVAGKPLLDAIRSEIHSFIQLEDAKLAQNNSEYLSKMNNLLIVIVASCLLVFLAVLVLTYLIYRETQLRFKNLVHLESERIRHVQEEERHKQLQQVNVTLRDSEERLAVTLKSIGDAVINTDIEASVMSMNPVAEKLTGWTEPEARGRPVSEVFHIINQETRQPSTIPVMETLAHGTIQGLANHTLLITRDGSECAIADSCAPICNHDGQVVGAVLVFRDVTEEYDIQQALRDQQFYSRSLLESNIDALMATDPSGIITDVNRQMEVLTGCTRNELIGTPFKIYFTDPARAEAGINQVLSENKVTDYELTAHARDGKETVVSYNATTFYDRDNKLKGVFAAARDITEGQRLNQILQDKNAELEVTKSASEKANLAKSDFLSSMSHELRTPLSAILGFAQLIESGSPAPTPSQKRSIDQILLAGWYLLELINEILDLALIESGKLSLSLESVSLTNVMHECQSMIEPQARRRDIKLDFATLEIPYFVNVDKTRVKQVFINLLSNAIKYNKLNGSVTVECRQSSPERVRISIKDSGAGLSPEQLTQLFQPFNRLGQKANSEEGTGIGLVMTKRLVELMGGAIGVESTVGTGSMFWFELNLAAEPQAANGANEAVSVDQTQIQTDAPLRTLLYVEDNSANLMLVEDLITRRPDIRLLSARDGNQGIIMARASLPDVILMDINLPGISGFAALRILAEDPTTAHIPVIALSANAMPRDIEKGLQAGFFRYLTKPIRVNDFMDTLNVTLKFAKRH